MTQPLVEVDKLIFRYGHAEVLHEISFTIDKDLNLLSTGATLYREVE